MRRITPAYTGKRSRPGCGNQREEDHPRIHGEKSRGRKRGETYPGSPPHTRGKVQASTIDILNVRITPAYTGKRAKVSQDIPEV